MRDRPYGLPGVLPGGLPGRFDPATTLVLAGVLTLLWTALSGASDYGFGLLAIAVTVLVSQALAPLPAMSLSLRGLIGFIGFFLHGSLAGGMDVAWRALSPRLPLDVERHWHPLGLPPGPPTAVLIGAISLLPGTLSAQLQGDRLLVHSISGHAGDRIVQLERRVARLFGLRLQTDDVEDR